MKQRVALTVLAAAFFLGACHQQAGEVCQSYAAGASDCADGLVCCGEAQTCDHLRQRGICVAAGTCREVAPLMCADDAGPVADAGDAGEVSSDAGSDAGFDAGTDAG